MKPLRHAAIAWLVLAAVVWLPGRAFAGTPSVTFTGQPVLNLGVLSCPSTPSVTDLTVAAGATVRFVNATGKPATLHVGPDTYAVADGEARSVRFSDAGAVAVSLIPKCTLDTATHGAVTVTVCAAGSSPVPSVPATVAGPTSGAGKPAGHTTGQQQAAAHSSATPRATPSLQPSSPPAVIAAGIPAEPQASASAMLVEVATVMLLFTGGWWVYRLRERGWRLL